MAFDKSNQVLIREIGLINIQVYISITPLTKFTVKHYYLSPFSFIAFISYFLFWQLPKEDTCTCRVKLQERDRSVNILGLG